VRGNGTSASQPREGPLAGLRVTTAVRPRAVLSAGAWLAELGARVQLLDGHHLDSIPTADAIRLGTRLARTAVDQVDLLLVAADEPSWCSATTQAVLFGSSPQGAFGGRMLDERELAAASGVAVAIGEPDREPLPPPPGLLDSMVGVHLAAAGLAGLLHGVGSVEVVAADAIASSVVVNASLYAPFGRPWYRAGPRASGSGGTYPYGILPAKDGQVCLIARTPEDWRGMLAAAGDPSWSGEPRFADLERAGREHAEELDALLGAWLGLRTRAEIVEQAARHRFPAGAVLRPAEVLEDPVTAPLWQDVRFAGTAARVPGAPFEVRSLGHGDDRPLADCLVLDLGWVWSAPGVAAGLADLGATVVKVESRTRPDNTRLRRGMRAARVDPAAPPLELSPYFHAVNRGKRSLSLDLKTPGGRRVLEDLAARADVIVENLTPGVMTRLGVDPEQVADRNPGCVYVSLRGYRDHPRTRGLRAYAPVLSSAAGVEALVGYPGERPLGMMTYGYSDANAVAQGLSLALAGLWARRRSGSGHAFTLFQHDGCVWANGTNLVAAQLEQFAVVEPLGDLDVVTYDRLATSPAVSQDLFRRLPHRWLGEVEAASLPCRLGGWRPGPDRPGPELGADTDTILRERLGWDEASLRASRAAGALR
jgi:crotonobetainyl-CoA:carnitine CoA-transferase CaiB-like acyl-CoA transferase